MGTKGTTAGLVGLKSGLPEKEALDLLTGMAVDRLEEARVTGNPFRFEEPTAQVLSDLWFGLRTKLTVAQKDRIGMAYLVNFLGFDRPTATLFVRGDPHADSKVGQFQAGIPAETPVLAFWRAVNRICPHLHDRTQLRYLRRKGGVVAVLHFTFQIDPITMEQSPVLRRINANAHVYK